MNAFVHYGSARRVRTVEQALNDGRVLYEFCRSRHTAQETADLWRGLHGRKGVQVRVFHRPTAPLEFEVRMWDKSTLARR